MPSYKTDAINLRAARLAEADKLMTFFTRENGRVSAVAKSAFRSGSSFGGRLELFGHNNLLLAKGRSLDIVSQVETIESFREIREKEPSLQAGMYIARVLYSFLLDRVKNEQLFDLTLDMLRLLKGGAVPGIVTRIFDVKFADLEGFLPLDRFPVDLRPQVEYIRIGELRSCSFSDSNLRDIDDVLAPSMCEHIGKDVRSWKSP